MRSPHFALLLAERVHTAWRRADWIRKQDIELVRKNERYHGSGGVRVFFLQIFHSLTYTRAHILSLECHFRCVYRWCTRTYVNALRDGTNDGTDALGVRGQLRNPIDGVMDES